MTKLSAHLEVEGRPHGEGFWVYALSGNLFGSTAGYAFQDEVRGKISSGTTRIVIDLSGVKRVDSSGVGILVALMWSTSQAGGALGLASIPPRVGKVLEIGMLLEHIRHADTVDEAVAVVAAMDLG
jgi:anti-sigma B factor antagonist